MQDVVPPSRGAIMRYVGGLSAAIVLTLLIWPGALRALFDSRTFMPHAFCYRWDSRLLWINGLSDALIGLSYIAISAMLTLLVHRARRDIPFSWIFLAFGMFIVACGGTHIMEVVTLYMPAYWFSGAVKIVTAVASVATALVLPPMIPKALAMVRDAKKSEERRVELQERLEALERERTARAEAEEASRSKDAFLATLSHELRTPMTAVLGWASMVNSGDLDEETRQLGLEAIERSARAQARLIDDLLDVSRIVTGKMSLDTQVIDVNEVIRSAVQTVQPIAEAGGVLLQASFGTVRRPLIADPARLQQVFVNLLANAIKFTPEEGHVTIASRADGDEVIVTVTDTGAGISSSFLPRIFDRFSQADESSTRAHGGLGLGLAIARSIVELHGGTVGAASQGEHLGATFTVRLPLASGSAELPTARKRETAIKELAGARVMLVEDDQTAREMLTVALRRAGAIVKPYERAAEALADFDSSQIDVVLTDIAMPGDDGISLLRKIRLAETPAGRRVPVIAVTAIAGEDERKRILDEGFDDFVHKPLEPAELVAAVARRLRSCIAQAIHLRLGRAEKPGRLDTAGKQSNTLTWSADAETEN
jgi:signal transduction histidine kinase/DNA-binding NarL/FixJ family response regulator